MPTNAAKFWNQETMNLAGSFDLSAAAAVLSISYPAGVTKTCRGVGMSCVKTGTGQYDVTLKQSSAQGPVFQAVELLYADAPLIATTVATVLSARVASVTLSATGDIVVRVITAQTSGAAADTTAAITVSFNVIISTSRDTSPI